MLTVFRDLFKPVAGKSFQRHLRHATPAFQRVSCALVTLPVVTHLHQPTLTQQAIMQ